MLNRQSNEELAQKLHFATGFNLDLNCNWLPVVYQLLQHTSSIYSGLLRSGSQLSIIVYHCYIRIVLYFLEDILDNLILFIFGRLLLIATFLLFGTLHRPHVILHTLVYHFYLTAATRCLQKVWYILKLEMRKERSENFGDKK